MKGQSPYQMIGLSQSPNLSLIELFKHISVDNLQATQNNSKLVTKPQATYIYKIIGKIVSAVYQSDG